MIGQRKLHSLIESVTNTVTGFLVALAMNYWLLPAFGFNPSPGQALAITCLFCSVSFVRGYIFRRIFNRWHVATTPVTTTLTLRGETLTEERLHDLLVGVGKIRGQDATEERMRELFREVEKTANG